MAGASGAHVGQDDLPVPAARALLGVDAILGCSTHTIEQIEAAAASPATYVAIGPVFGTRSKETGYNAVGLSLVAEAAGRAAGKPIVAIGGITLETAPAVIEAGASCVAVISDLLAGDPSARVQAYLSALATCSARRTGLRGEP
jgi:thiamine-phosphate pyrophosphorylase